MPTVKEVVDDFKKNINFSGEYEYIIIETFPSGRRQNRIFNKVTNLKTIVTVENAPGFNINSFNYVGEDGLEYTMHEIHGEIIEMVSVKKPRE